MIGGPEATKFNRKGIVRSVDRMVAQTREEGRRNENERRAIN